MHEDHPKFMQAVNNRRKVILTHFSGRYNLNLTKAYVPLQYAPSGEGEDSDCYYLWDSEADVGDRVLILSPSQILYMELSDDTFDPDEYIVPESDHMA